MALNVHGPHWPRGVFKDCPSVGLQPIAQQPYVSAGRAKALLKESLQSEMATSRDGYEKSLT